MRQSKELYLTTAILFACSFIGSGSNLAGQDENDATKENSNTQKHISIVVTNSIGMKFKPLKVGMKGVTFTMGAAGERAVCQRGRELSRWKICRRLRRKNGTVFRAQRTSSRSQGRLARA